MRRTFGAFSLLFTLVALTPGCKKSEADATASSGPRTGAKPTALLHTKAGDTRAIVYGADWCEACHVAGGWLTRHGYTVIERDVERERDGAEAMQDALDAAGLTAQGIPVIEVEGAVVVGFDEKKLTPLCRPEASTPR